MIYIIQAELDPEAGVELEANPDMMQELIGKWQALNPIGHYFSLTRRAMTVILEAPNEDAFFEALHFTWVATNDYPEVTPVAGVDKFPDLLKRAGITE